METVILMRLVAEEEFHDLLQRVDVFAGVSGGAIVAAGLATGITLSFSLSLIFIFISF